MVQTPDYKMLARQVAALAEEDARWVPTLSNASALIWEAVGDINWAGFYLHESTEDGTDWLVLGPFQGKVACVHIAVGRGVCGTAVVQDATQLVADVHTFPGHLACDAASRSEVVVPLHGPDGIVTAVLDIDSPTVGRFGQEDAAGLELVARTLETAVRW